MKLNTPFATGKRAHSPCLACSRHGKSSGFTAAWIMFLPPLFLFARQTLRPETGKARFHPSRVHVLHPAEVPEKPPERFHTSLPEML